MCRLLIIPSSHNLSASFLCSLIHHPHTHRETRELFVWAGQLWTHQSLALNLHWNVKNCDFGLITFRSNSCWGQTFFKFCIGSNFCNQRPHDFFNILLQFCLGLLCNGRNLEAFQGLFESSHSLVHAFEFVVAPANPVVQLVYWAGGILAIHCSVCISANIIVFSYLDSTLFDNL